MIVRVGRLRIHMPAYLRDDAGRIVRQIERSLSDLNMTDPLQGQCQAVTGAIAVQDKGRDLAVVVCRNIKKHLRRGKST